MKKGKVLLNFLGILLCCTVVIFLNSGTVLADGSEPVGGSGSGFSNPLEGGASSISGVLVKVIQWALGISAMLAMLALVVGGIRLIISFGNSSGVEAAKKNITWAIVGIIVIVLSYAIIRWVSGAVGVDLS